uniref:Gamma-secretase subunit PEN-2 n=1 Tax=Panagrellus redivivus TaxID=6233 RepID=A0A7E4VQA8_PANRE
MSSRSPSNPPPMFPRQMNHDSASNVLLNPTDTNVRNAIWGPWYWFAKCTFQFFSVPPEAPKFVKFLSNLPNLITLGVFIVRSVFLLYVMMRSKISRVPGKSLLKCTVTVLTFTVPAAIYIIECFIRYSKHEEKFNSYYAGNSTQLNSIYG